MSKPKLFFVSLCLALCPSINAWSETKASDEKLFFSVAKCWLGPVWGDAIGEIGADRRASAEESCQSVAMMVWGSADSTHVLQLRAFERTAVEDVGNRLHGDKEFFQTYRIFATAQQENMLARRAAERIKIDIDDKRGEKKFTADERAAIAPFRAQKGVSQLLTSSQRDARALGIISAMDRMELARGLPKHMKIYALAGIYGTLFGVHAKLPASPTVHAAPGEWLAFLADGAKAAGHAPPASGEPRHRFALAWGGVLEGFADQLRPELERVSPELHPVVEGVIRRLQAEYTGIRNGERDGEQLNW